MDSGSVRAPSSVDPGAGTQHHVPLRPQLQSNQRSDVLSGTQHTSEGEGGHHQRTVFGSAVTAQRTLEFVPLEDVEVLLSVDGDLCGEVALFLALRFNAWLRHIATAVVAAHDAWMTVAARFLLARRIAPPVDTPTHNQCPSWLAALRDVPPHETLVVPLACDDVVHEWIARVALNVDFEDGRCCAEYARAGMAVL